MALGSVYLDLHNDYECVRSEYKGEDKECRLTFKLINTRTESSYDVVDIVFIDSIMHNFYLFLMKVSLMILKQSTYCI